MSVELMKGFEWCQAGCGLQHRTGSTDPIHDPAWLGTELMVARAEAVRLRAALVEIVAVTEHAARGQTHHDHCRHPGCIAARVLEVKGGA